MTTPYILKKAVRDNILEILNRTDLRKARRLWITLQWDFDNDNNLAFLDDDELDDWIKAINSGKEIINPQTAKERFKNIMKGRRKGTFKGMEGCGIFIPEDDFNFISGLAEKELNNES